EEEDEEGVWIVSEYEGKAGCNPGSGSGAAAVAAVAGGVPCWQREVEASRWEHGAGATTNILHTGDCRWQPWMRHQPGLAGVRVDTLLLDTTYAAPRHTLPPQSEAIRMMVQAMRDALLEEPRTVFLLAAYHIGKERAFLEAAQELGAKVWCSPAKRAVLRLLQLPTELAAVLAEDPREACIHVTGWGLRPEDVQAYLERYPGVWKRAVGIRPTGWTFRRSGGISVRRQGGVTVLGVPYSEHSSWTDLCDAVAQLRPRRLVPTVNAATSSQRRALVDLFAPLMDLSADRSRLDVYLSRTAGGPRGGGGPGVAVATPDRPDRRPTGCSPGAAGVRVDLARVDLAEQARILDQLREQRLGSGGWKQQRQQEGLVGRSSALGKRKLQDRDDEGWPVEGEMADQRQQQASAGDCGQGVGVPHAPQGLGQPSRLPQGAGGGEQCQGCGAVRPPGSLAGTQRGASCRQAGAMGGGCGAGADGAAAHASAAAPPGLASSDWERIRRRSSRSCGGRSVCMIDLTLDEGWDSEGSVQSTVKEAAGSELVSLSPVRAAALVNRRAEAGGEGTAGAAVVARKALGGQRALQAVASQSSIRRFFTPVRRVVTVQI
ncbi:hypothetical protein Agub_g4703, partial [Astrephomene gubernaculifera]